MCIFRYLISYGPLTETCVLLCLQTDVKRGDKNVSHVEIDSELQRETEYHGCHFDIFSTGMFSCKVNVEKRKFLRGLRYLRESFLDQIFTPERLKHELTSFNNSVSIRLKSPSVVISEVLLPRILTQNSNPILLSTLSQYELMTSIADDVLNHEAEETRRKLREITEYITDPRR